MTPMAMQKTVTNPDAGYCMGADSYNAWKANEAASSGELQKLQNWALKTIISFYNN